jgi:hypothetical protein
VAPPLIRYFKIKLILVAFKNIIYERKRVAIENTLAYCSLVIITAVKELIVLEIWAVFATFHFLHNFLMNPIS